MTSGGSVAGDRRLFDVREVLRMIDCDVFAEEERIELVQGELLAVQPESPTDACLRTELHARLVFAYAEVEAHILGRGPVLAGLRGLPMPDVAVVRGGARQYLDRHPTGADLLLVIELATSSQVRDHDKAMDYAAGGVPVYWLVDLVARVVEVHSDPDPQLGRFRSVVVLDEDEELTLPELDLRWLVASLLP